MKYRLSPLLYRRAQQKLNRPLTEEEDALLASLWSEHCSYCHSRHLLKQLPRQGNSVVASLGENAGALEIEPGLSAVFKIESHNHPTAVFPYQGAATGVGGIVRDVLAMGAKPIALLNSLHFDLTDEKSQGDFEEAIRGASDYGNCLGIPTVGGEVDSHPGYRHSPLVNVACLGVVPTSQLIRKGNIRPGDWLVCYGNTTGRDGLGGAAFASSSLDNHSSRSSVQVADPFTGKLVLDATQELVKQKLISGLQDFGAAGLACVAAELAYGSQLGIRLELEKLPLRQPLKPWEILLSESQERMGAVVPPKAKSKVEKILSQYHLPFGWIGVFTPSSDLQVFFQGEKIIHLPLSLIFENAPKVEYFFPEKELREERLPSTAFSPSFEKALSLFQKHPHLGSKHKVFEQFDAGVGLRIRTLEPRREFVHLWEGNTTLALAIQSRSRWVERAPYQGSLATLALAYRHLISLGARPLGLVNCLNFPSPERDKVKKDFAKTIQAMKDFCHFFSLPVVGGNVSFYNETPQGAIPPTPVFLLLGKVHSFWGEEDLKEGYLYALGEWRFDQGELGESVPKINLDQEKQWGEALLELACPKLKLWEIGRGGLFKRLLENLPLHFDVRLFPPSHWSSSDLLFGEGKGAYLLYAPEGFSLPSSLPFRKVGHITQGEGNLILGKIKISLREIQKSWREQIPL